MSAGVVCLPDQGAAAAGGDADGDGGDIDVLAEMEDVALVPKHHGRAALEMDVAASDAPRAHGGGPRRARVFRITKSLCLMALPVSATYFAGVWCGVLCVRLCVCVAASSVPRV